MWIFKKQTQMGSSGKNFFLPVNVMSRLFRGKFLAYLKESYETSRIKFSGTILGRQYKLTITYQDFYLDLLFYNIKLRCFIVVELKKGDFKPEYAGKMNFYCSAVDDILKQTEDQATIGLILCESKNKVFAEYALRDINKPIGVSEYELTRALPDNLKSSLPSIEEIEAELSSNREVE